MVTYPRITLKPGKEEALKRFHPWIFSGALAGSSGRVEEGEIVEVFSHDSKYLATGYAIAGSIAVKLISFVQTEINEEFWLGKIQNAFQLRQRLGLTGNPSTNAYRLVFGEADQIPGLIVDFLNGLCVIQCHTVGMYLLRESIAKALQRVFGGEIKSIFCKSAETLSRLANFESVDGFLFGDFLPDEICENDIKYSVDIFEGQKTGFFLDQRENRALLGHYAKGKKVADLFCYSGGFALNALKSGATLVHTVDSSKKAIALTEKNMVLNEFNDERHQSFASDAQSFLDHMTEEYDIIVLDPPAFAKQQSQRSQALKGYRNINYQALKNIRSGGLLFTFSCSQAVDKQSFQSAVMAAAIQAKRPVMILHYLSQPPDHAVNFFHPEGEYLKGLVLYVE